MSTLNPETMIEETISALRGIIVDTSVSASDRVKAASLVLSKLCDKSDTPALSPDADLSDLSTSDLIKSFKQEIATIK